jgi:hypothetical protein
MPKLLKVVNSSKNKPSKMPQESWKQLCGYAFGHIIFPVPKTNAVPMPTIVGEGDLDGDDYFVCWDDDILKALAQPRVRSRMKADEKVQLEQIEEYDNGSEGPRYRKGSPKWLEAAQDVMLDFSVVSRAGEITGKLFNLSVQMAKESKDGIYDRDARVFARAFKDSIDTLKHGGVVKLPVRLQHKISPEPSRVLLFRLKGEIRRGCEQM